MNDLLRLTAAFLFLAALMHCGSTRIAIGGGCASSSECVDGAVCAGAVCVKACATDGDCPAGQACAILPNSTVTACQ